MDRNFSRGPGSRSPHWNQVGSHAGAVSPSGLKNMDVALLAARVLDQRATTREAESTLAPFVKNDWSVDERAKFIKAAQAMAEATAQPLSVAAEILVRQIEVGRKTQLTRVISSRSSGRI